MGHRLCSLNEPLPAAKVHTQASDDKQPKIADKSELAKATEWWGKKYAENPRDLEAALSYARNLKAMGEKQRALAVLQQASIFHGEDHKLASEYWPPGARPRPGQRRCHPAGGRRRSDQSRLARHLRARNGACQARQIQRGHSLLRARSDPRSRSAVRLEQPRSGACHEWRAGKGRADAARLGRRSAAPKIRQNLALVLGLQGKNLEAKQVADLDMPADKAAENADYLRRVVKLDSKNDAVDESLRSPRCRSRPAATRASGLQAAEANCRKLRLRGGQPRRRLRRRRRPAPATYSRLSLRPAVASATSQKAGRQDSAQGKEAEARQRTAQPARSRHRDLDLTLGALTEAGQRRRPRSEGGRRVARFKSAPAHLSGDAASNKARRSVELPEPDGRRA